MFSNYRLVIIGIIKMISCSFFLFMSGLTFWGLGAVCIGIFVGVSSVLYMHHPQLYLFRMENDRERMNMEIDVIKQIDGRTRRE